MVQWDSTRTERMARLKEHLEGVSPRRGMPTKAGTGGNLLWGLTLHTAAKLDAGQKLSDLEVLLGEAVKILLPEDEVKEMGRAWEQARSGGAMPLFPKAATQLEVTDAYSCADLARDLPGVGAELVELPTTSVVRIDKPEAQSMDSEEFLAAIAETGHGMTVVLGPPQEETDTLNQAISVELYLPYFDCIRGTGDSFFGPDDEVYWTMASGSDLHAKHVFGSQEFGSLESGDKRNFPPGTNVFLGMVKSFVFLDIECWEKDRGGFWDTIKNALEQVSNACVDSATEALENGGGGEHVLTGLIGTIGKLISALLDAILGKDDLIQHRTLGFDRSALQTLIDRSTNYDFKGSGGHYTLHIGARKLPSAMRLVTLNEGATNWSAPQNMPGMHALANPGLAADRERLHCMVTRPGTNTVDQTMFDGHIWSPPLSDGNSASTSSGVVMCRHGDRVLYAFRTNSSRLTHVRRLNPENPDKDEFLGQGSFTTYDAPAIATYQSSVYVFSHVAAPVMMQKVNLSNSTLGPISFLPLSTLNTVAVAEFRQRLYVVYRDTSNELQYTSWDGAAWTAPQSMGGHFTVDAPAIAAFGGRLYCVYRGHNNNYLWWTSFEGSVGGSGTWTRGKVINGANSDNGPGIAVFNNQLYCVYHDNI
ncbi:MULTISPECIES: hypothetical protein [unclassified Streptomyces]|uniref:hypothetical protein n=1 Tax=unclassified Streptomyces TaxID=2593676 RepID=UPI0024A8D6F2|nr:MULTISPECIES: hypothetical protein [unclassified Streptomyces]